MLTDLAEQLRPYIGLETEPQTACDLVERGAVRRFAHAVMDPDPIYDAAGEHTLRYGGPVAPPLFPAHHFRRAFGDDDPIAANAHDPDFDGTGGASTQGLPVLEPLKGYALLNGGIDVEFHRYARHGDAITLKSRYADLVVKESSKGPMVLVTIESDYRNERGELLLRTRRTLIRRK